MGINDVIYIFCHIDKDICISLVLYVLTNFAVVIIIFRPKSYIPNYYIILSYFFNINTSYLLMIFIHINNIQDQIFIFLLFL